MAQKLRAIDLYSGIGGWSLGLRLAGIDVVASYDIWGEANETNFLNNGHSAQTVDIRRLPLEDLPKDIDIVVGSPPCTQFSYANRGGNGDLVEGLIDIAQFLKIVNYAQPRFWVMENVPRVKKLLTSALGSKGPLAEFADMQMFIETFDMSQYGLPQRRIRCLAGNVDFRAIQRCQLAESKRTLGYVLKCLDQEHVDDPIYNLNINSSDLTENHPEPLLNSEEIRINRALKRQHHVYNAMNFPDSLSDSARTINATCTRVSRESIIIQLNKLEDKYRRLTIRERACLQGFPLNYQFYANTGAKKAKMIGNAMPPSFAYIVATTLLKEKGSIVRPLAQLTPRLSGPRPIPPITATDGPGKKYPSARRFRFAIPSLRLKSGVRFELSNIDHMNQIDCWSVSFWFGSSKCIHTINCKTDVSHLIHANYKQRVTRKIEIMLLEKSAFFGAISSQQLQRVWSHRGPGLVRPFDLLDILSDAAGLIEELTATEFNSSQNFVDDVLKEYLKAGFREAVGREKLIKNASKIAAGFLIATCFNQNIKKSDTEEIEEEINTRAL